MDRTEAILFTLVTLAGCAFYGSLIFSGVKFGETRLGALGGWHANREEEPRLFWLAMFLNGVVLVVCLALLVQAMAAFIGMPASPNG